MTTSSASSRFEAGCVCDGDAWALAWRATPTAAAAWQGWQNSGQRRRCERTQKEADRERKQ
uniref:Uncharacterized protein n=1 Tax=Oryza brachyantha TaxID=4533 RepID=J3KZW8_ORYBR